MLVKQTRLTKLIAFLIPALIWLFILLELDLSIKNAHGDYQPNWGVLAINTNKSYYFPGEEAQFEFAALDDTGTMVCDASLELQIINENTNQIIDTLSTKNGSINTNPDCHLKNGAREPDFSSYYRFKDEGTYTLKLRATTHLGEKSISRPIIVKNDIPFDVERKTFTRIFPQNTYRVDLKIKAGKNFRGEVEETVPMDFDIAPSSLFEIDLLAGHKFKKLSWQVTWEKGQEYELTYFYKAPAKSPEFYQLGPLKISEYVNFLEKMINKKKVVFRELEPWQIAGDAFLNRYSSTCTSPGPKLWSNLTNAQGSPALGSAAVLGDFDATNSSIGFISDTPELDCSGFSSRDLGEFTSARIWFSFATEGTNNGGDYVDINYTVGATPYDLTIIYQAPNAGQSNDTNNGYWNYPASNITSWADVGNTTVNFIGAKDGGPDRQNAYVDAVWIEVEYTPRLYTQNDFEWFAPQGSVSLTNVWPVGGGEDLIENQVLTQFPASNEPLKSGAQIRLQMNFTVSDANLPATTESFNLEYAANEDCTAASSWQQVGAKASGEIWRLYDETSLADSTAQANQIQTSDTGAEGYFTEIISTANNPNAVNSTQTSEWDWPLENNGALDNTTYCFRMVLFDGSGFNTYNPDSYPKLTTAPGPSNLMRHGNIFQNSSEKGFFWAN